MKPSVLFSREEDRRKFERFGEALIRRLESIEARIAEPGLDAPILASERFLLQQVGRPTADSTALEQQRIRDRALDEVYFREALTYSNTVLTTAATASNADARVIRFPNAGGFANRVVAERDLWIRTRPKIEVWYTSPVGSTANFDLGFALWTFGLTGTTTFTPLAVAWSAPGPAVANDILKTQATITSGLLPSSPFGSVRLRLERTAGDANANDLDVLLALVTFEEIA